MSTAELEQDLAGRYPVFSPELIPAPSRAEPYEEPARALFLVAAQEEVEQTAIKKTSPVDPLSHMPLPILPTDTIPRIIDGKRANWHHHYHPSDDPLLTSISGLAVRHLRLQLLPVKTRHQVYHNMFIGPEELPETNDQRFGHIILACAGYLPRLAVDVRKDDPSEPVVMTNKMYERLQTSGEIAIRGQGNISNFIRSHLVLQNFSHVNESVIDEFLHTPNMNRKRYLGHWLLAIASEIATEPLEPIYHQALDSGLVRQKKKLPNVAKTALIGQKTQDKAIKDLHRRLIRQQ